MVIMYTFECFNNPLAVHWVTIKYMSSLNTVIYNVVDLHEYTRG